MIEEIDEIIGRLNSLTENKEERISILVQTGHDECGFVGTSEAYINLARTILEFVSHAKQGHLNTWNMGGHKLAGTTAISKNFDSLCEVVIDSMCMAPTDAVSKQVSEYFQLDSPPHKQE